MKKLILLIYSTSLSLVYGVPSHEDNENADGNHVFSQWIYYEDTKKTKPDFPIIPELKKMKSKVSSEYQFLIHMAIQEIERSHQEIEHCYEEIERVHREKKMLDKKLKKLQTWLWTLRRLEKTERNCEPHFSDHFYMESEEKMEQCWHR